jgi:hypothetical protein
MNFVGITAPALQQEVSCLRQWHERYATELWDRAPAAVAAAARLFLNKESMYHQRAVALADRIGMSGPMVAEAINNLLGPISVAKLEKLRRQQLGRTPHLRRTLPRIVFHNLAGNVFVSGWESLILATLVGACNLVRTSSIDLHFPTLWCSALAEVDPVFTRATFCFWCPHEAQEILLTAVASADAVVAFGDDTAVESVRGLTSLHKPFLGHGHKISFALLDERDVSNVQSLARFAKRIAYDFCVYDQQGCLSPRTLFVRTRSQRFVCELAEQIAQDMRKLSVKLPRHPLALEEAVAQTREREETLIHMAAAQSRTARQPVDQHAKLISKFDDPFLVAIRSLEPFWLPPVNRTVILRPFANTAALAKILLPHRGHINTLGVSAARDEWLAIAHELGASRICPLGKMQKPPLGWTHDGYQPLTALSQAIETSELRLSN